MKIPGTSYFFKNYFVYFKFNGKFTLTVSGRLPFKKRKMLMKNADKAFDALGEPMRRIIFEKLKARPLAVGAIAKGLPISRPAVSQHLKVLREAKLITIEQVGTQNLCQIDPNGLLAMRAYLDNFWDVTLAAFKSAVEKESKK